MLGNRAAETLGDGWVDLSAADVWSSLMCDVDLARQVEKVLEADVDFFEGELNNLLSQARNINCGIGQPPRARPKRTCQSVTREPGLSRCQFRSHLRRLKRQKKRQACARKKRKLACFKASAQYRLKRHGHLLVGTWNTRGLGAPKGVDPEGKIRALFRLMSERKWGCALLTDLQFPEDGVCEVMAHGETWLLLHEGKVGVALNQRWAARWREGGSVVIRAKGWSDGVRALGLCLPAKGWKAGLLLVPVYAPLAHHTPLELREEFRDKLSHILDHSSSRRRLVVGGDFNAEVGAVKDSNWRHVLGPYGDDRRTKGGEELLRFCEQEQLVVANTYTRQRQRSKATWYHFKWGTAHALDHFLVRSVDRRWVASVLTVHFASTQVSSGGSRLGRPAALSTAPWLAYTDHDPVELSLRVGKDWLGERRSQQSSETRPHVLRFLGSSREASELRTQYAEVVCKELESLSGTRVDWDLVAGVMKRSAIKVVGLTPKRHAKPWLQGKESELVALETAVRNQELSVRTARREGAADLQPLIDARRVASSNLRSAKRRWEACWWDDLAAQANLAGSSGNDFAFWQVCKQLGLRESETTRTGCKRTCSNLEKEREAWKSFLHDIQADEGAVAEEVWEHIPVADAIHESLATLPSRSEFNAALAKMKFGKRGGDDDVTVELVRFGGETLKLTIFQVVSDMWKEASEAEAGHEADKWCASSKSGVCIPMFKNKGSRSDKSNYRNLVMLSVSAKLVARIVASRLTTWIPEEQNGFRPHRGIDDVQQFIRRVLEEVSVAAAPAAFGLTCFDIVRAYTRVCRTALWKLLSRLGVPAPFLSVLKALHEHTCFRVFVHNGYSSSWFTNRGLREGCPSSPVLFSIFHHAVLLTFRARRASLAQSSQSTPGIAWNFKVDGHLTRPGRARRSSRGVRSAVIGDVEFADDTALIGWVDELKGAEAVFIQTLLDWSQKEHEGKREKLILLPGGRKSTDVLNKFEVRMLKHLGATHCDSADQWAETKRRVQAGFFAVKRVAKYWSLGSKRGRGSRSGLSNCRKLRVMRCVLEGTLLACCKTRVWSLMQERKANQVLARGVRRCLGLDRFNMRDFGYSDEALRQMVQWNDFSSLLHRSVLLWLGHVARMDCGRLPKMALFGWPAGLENHRSPRYTFPMWAQWLLQKHGISTMDWFRLAQKPTRNWFKIVDEALPRLRLSATKSLALDQWRPGQPVNVPRVPAAKSSASTPSNQDSPSFKCPACNFQGENARALQIHYDNEHAIQGGNLTTVDVGQCPLCLKTFVYQREKKNHRCPTKPQTLEEVEKMQEYPTVPTALDWSAVDVSSWQIYTDGSGPVKGVAPFAGWGVAVWDGKSDSTSPNVRLFGPVCLSPGDSRYLGAESHTNNVGELSAMVEALIWLEQEAPGAPSVPATLFYDSSYAHGIITGAFVPEANIALAEKAKFIYQRISQSRPILFQHVKGHSGNNGNDWADKLAGQGAKGHQTSQSKRWLAPINAPPQVDPLLIDHCWRCGRVYSGPKYARQLAGHEAYCTVSGAPPSHIPCRRKCGRTFPWTFAVEGKTRHHAREARSMHEKICRGSEELTRTCPFCNKQLPRGYSDEYLLKHRATCPSRPADAPSLSSLWACPSCKARVPADKRESHESYCRGSVKENRTCSQCRAFFQTIEACCDHETWCRGSDVKNKTCSKCSRVFSTIGSRTAHEKSCSS